MRRQRRLLLSFFFSVVAWLLIAPSHTPQLRTDDPRDSRLLLLTAHPDDECMFFSPAILSLLALGIDIYALCLSIGNADGLGHVREKEIHASFNVLGVPPQNVHTIDHPDLQDNISRHWDESLVAEVARRYVIQYDIKHILTFDTKGISMHPNHISLAYGARHLASSDPGLDLHIHTLHSVPTLPFKYAGLLSPISAHLQTKLLSRIGDSPQLFGGTFAAGWREYVTALQAMMKHRSQLVWFRWLYVSFSQYMWVNDVVLFYPNISSTQEN